MLGPFHFEVPDWANTQVRDDPEACLARADSLAKSFYPLGVQTGIHSMIEWCGVMGEYVRMLRVGYEQGLDPREVDQHHGLTVSVKTHMIEYFCEKLGCQLKPFIRANKEEWRRQIDRWFV